MSSALRLVTIAAIVTVASTAAVHYSDAALATEVTSLPGLPPNVPFKMFSGYIPVDKAETRKLFYWFVESQNDPATDPLLLWTNGGPGCSGLAGFMTEQGPFRPTADGNLTMNPHAWNKLANMVFIEQPAGVGFSTTSVPMQYNDSQAAWDNAAFLHGFLNKYTAFNTSDLYITSESYGGHYMPTLAKELVLAKGSCFSDGDCPGSYCLNDATKSFPYQCHSGKAFTPNFKGFMVGNPLTYMPYRDYGEFGTYAGHNLLPKPEWDKYLAAGCRQDDSSDACQALMNKFGEITSGLDPYALDFPVCSTAAAAGRHERYTLLKTTNRLKGYFPENYTPCDADWATTYLNTPAVQKALGVVGTVKWGECSNTVSGKYSQQDTIAPMMPIYKWLVEKAPEVKILVYSGDDDAVCATLGTQQWIWDMGYPISDEWAAWKMDGQTSGYHVSFGANGSAFHFATVHGAGHMVPATRPAQSLQVLENYLSGKW